ncbi:MAG TPA: hypothetical protein VGK97_02960 [Spongiibacteraceae bacterium]|jgi:hypothetical protein
MLHRIKRLLNIVLTVATLNTVACGYLIYPERQGQRGDHVDGTVVALDAVGLLFFILPGVVAFAVDFASGCIYLPKGKDGVFSLNETAPHDWVAVARVAPFADDATIANTLQDYLRHDRSSGAPLKGGPARNGSVQDNSVRNSPARIEWLPGSDSSAWASNN